MATGGDMDEDAEVATADPVATSGYSLPLFLCVFSCVYVCVSFPVCVSMSLAFTFLCTNVLFSFIFGNESNRMRCFEFDHRRIQSYKATREWLLFVFNDKDTRQLLYLITHSPQQLSFSILYSHPPCVRGQSN